MRGWLRRVGGAGDASRNLSLPIPAFFDEGRYFDVLAEYAKGSPDDILIKLTVAIAGSRRESASDSHDLVPQYVVLGMHARRMRDQARHPQSRTEFAATDACHAGPLADGDRFGGRLAAGTALHRE